MLLKMGVATIGTVISVRNRPSDDDGVSTVFNQSIQLDRLSTECSWSIAGKSINL